MTEKPRRLRIRRCNGNHNAWMLVHLRDDGSEIDSFGGSITAVCIDWLVNRPSHLQPRPGDIVELVP